MDCGRVAWLLYSVNSLWIALTASPDPVEPSGPSPGTTRGGQPPAAAPPSRLGRTAGSSRGGVIWELVAAGVRAAAA